MEKSSTGGTATKDRRGSGAPEDRVQQPSSGPRPKSKDRGPQPKSTERRYKEMLHTTSHIYQPQAASDLSNASEEGRLSNPNTRTPSREGTMPVPVERVEPAAGVLPEGIKADVPLAEIMRRDHPTPAVINSEDVSGIHALEDGKAKSVPEENVVDGSLQEGPQDNSLLNHNPDANGGAVQCSKHSSARANMKPRNLIGHPKLCESCTVSMLSYIAILRDMLDEVTNEIVSPENESTQCVECIKERVIQRNQVRTSTDADYVPSDVAQRPRDLPITEQSQTIAQSSAGDRTSMAGGAPAVSGDMQQGYQQAARSIDQQQRRTVGATGFQKSDSTQMDARISSEDSTAGVHMSQHLPLNQQAAVQSDHRLSERQVEYEGRTDIPAPQSDIAKLTDISSERLQPRRPGMNGVGQLDRGHIPPKLQDGSESRLIDHSGTPSYVSDKNGIFGDSFREVVSDQPPSWQPESSSDHRHGPPSASARDGYGTQTSPFLRDGEGVDGILSALSNEEREVYDSARGRAGWEQLTDSQDYRDTSFGPGSTTEEAFVTMATTNAEAISCLVLGSSLSLCRTTRTLCVLVTDGVSPSLRAPLASVFQVVQSIRSLDTVGTTKVALLDQPDLGIFFRKLHLWRLVEFSKCVFLNPDTLVIQNCDELFCHEELSAVPDIGWPDCFNSGVFVFQPSNETFWKLVQFAESEGSYDGGDQGLLNAFFKTWSKDIHKKLSFIYNLMANVSYTYTPAFKQFGRNVKIVQFQGPFKPWHVKFYTDTSQIAPSTAVHPTYVQFVHIWLNIFRVRVLPLFSQDVQSFASSRNVISASELMKFYPSPIETEPDFLLTPPSVRIRPDPPGIAKQPSIKRRHSIGTYKELTRDQLSFELEGAKEDTTRKEPPVDETIGASITTDSAPESTDLDGRRGAEECSSVLEEKLQAAEEKLAPEAEEIEAREISVTSEDAEEDASRRSSIPGSEFGDYQGMAAWEQGRMDYMGSASSENIIKRLHFLMDNPSDSPE